MAQIRPESQGDRAAIRRIHEAAFGQATEPDLVDALREDGAHVLSLVAVEEDEAVGHVLFGRAHLDTGAEILALAPIGVVPAHQGRGIGAALVTEGLERASGTDFPLVVVLGHADYYPRFGFEPGEEHGITAPFEVPTEAWMVHLLPAYRREVRGEVVYPPAFEGV